MLRLYALRYTNGKEGGAERKKRADKPNYLLRIQRKCVINCGDPEESWRLFEPVGLRVGDKSALLFTIFNWGCAPTIQLASSPNSLQTQIKQDDV